MNGFLNMLRPPGMSSNDLVGFVRRRLPRGIRVGRLQACRPGESIRPARAVCAEKESSER